MAAYTAAMAAGLIGMVAAYSKGRSHSKTVEKKIDAIIKQSKEIRQRLLVLVDLDAESYLKVVKASKKNKSEKRKALKTAQKVPKEVTKLCYKAVDLIPYLVKNGNPYLVSDLEVAAEHLLSAYNSAMILINANE